MPANPAAPMRRLKKRAEFLRAARGNKVAGRGFVLQAVPVETTDFGVGFTVTNKIGDAPVRNRIRRRLREVVKACQGGFVAGHDYVLIGRRASLNEPFEALVDGLKSSLVRVHSSGQPANARPSGRHRKP
jgi:ribonuclease P protein component